MRLLFRLILGALTSILLAGGSPQLPQTQQPPSPPQEQQAPIPYHKEPHLVDSGVHESLTAESAVAFQEVVRVPQAPWLRLHFGNHNLGTQSFITITSLEDGGKQRLDATSLSQWRNASAYFNGDAVVVKLHVAPGEKGIFFRIEEITVGEWVGGDKVIPFSTSQGPIPEDLCGSDDRVASTDPRVGRIVPIGCTGWIASNGAHLTAGHCVGSAMTTLEFNVPASQCDGTIVHPGPNDQYAIDTGSIVSHDNGLGDDWAVFDCFPNANTGLLPIQAQGAFFRMSRDDAPSSVRVTGYGLDSTPTGCTGEYNTDSQTEQTDSGTYLGETGQGSSVYIEYTVDTENGNSGSPVIIPGTARTIGIHTNGGCDPPNAGNYGTGFENDDLENAIQTFPGANVMYVDRDHPVSTEDGTVFRPFDSVSEAIIAVPTNGIVSIVAGSYNEQITLDKAMTLIAPVGTVTIGP